ncbi:Pentatricopeptide repeat-containing protein [Acorus calamus]|uniref:Pentatricopeptide repeat-containing protein n=1 Tax=Acorus calamus TaxID=4465 RepID=A0AAV9EVX5_ACOCL|nr:Pentatricopeptide repeat-containing protein [Acorus calamus]
MRDRDLVSFSALISAQTRSRNPRAALFLFACLRRERLLPNHFVLSASEDPFVRTSLVDAYASFGELGSAVSVFSRGPVDDPVLVGVDSDRFVGTSLVDMYGEFGDTDGMRTAFEAMHSVDLVSYNALMVGFTCNGFDHAVLRLLGELRSRGFRPNECTLSSALKACGGLACLKSGKTLHGFVLKSEYFKDLVVNTALIDMYMKCERVAEGCLVFDRMEEKSVISYNSMIFGLGQHGHHKEAVKLFVEMNRRRLQTDPATLVALRVEGVRRPREPRTREVHPRLRYQTRARERCRHGERTLIDMYSKCGALKEGSRVFEESPKSDVVPWNTLISGLAQHGFGEDALELYRTMEAFGVEPNRVTFVSLLTGCSRCGLVEEGVRLFDSMREKHGLMPVMEHYVCVVDMLGRAGLLERARGFIEDAGLVGDRSVWTVLLAACGMHGDVEMAGEVMGRLESVGWEDGPALVMVSNVCAGVGRWGEAEGVRSRMRGGGGRGAGGGGGFKQLGLSWVQTVGG